MSMAIRTGPLYLLTNPLKPSFLTVAIISATFIPESAATSFLLSSYTLVFASIRVYSIMPRNFSWFSIFTLISLSGMMVPITVCSRTILDIPGSGSANSRLSVSAGFYVRYLSRSAVRSPPRARYSVTGMFLESPRRNSLTTSFPSSFRNVWMGSMSLYPLWISQPTGWGSGSGRQLVRQS